MREFCEPVPESYLTKIVGLTYLTISLRNNSSQATLSLQHGKPTREKCEDFQVPKQKQLRTDDQGGRTLRTKQNKDIEILMAAAEAEFLCAGWLFDQRDNTERPAS